MTDTARPGLVAQIRAHVAAGRERLGALIAPDQSTETPEEPTGGAPDPGPPQNPRETILTVLPEMGGRAKQSDLVKRTKWSKSTVSRTLSEMEGTGDVVRRKIGHEKIVALPGELADLPEASADSGEERVRLTA